MKKSLILISICFVFSFNNSCKQKNLTDVSLINGYWEIDFVKKKNEIFKPKGKSTTFDYYYLDENNGFRKKVQLLEHGILKASNDAAYFKTLNKKNKILFLFKTEWDSWEESLLKINSISLILEIEGRKYFYKRIIL